MLKSYGYKNVITSLGDFTKEDILQDLDIDCKFKKTLCAFLDDDRNDVPTILFVELRRKLIDDDVVTEEDKSNSSLINYFNPNCSIHHQLAQHIQIVSALLQEQMPNTSLCVPEVIKSPSYSFMYALDDGLSLVLFSFTHAYSPLKYVIHNSMGVRILLKSGMVLMWNGNLLHSGAKSRTNSSGCHLYDMRLFSYLWQESKLGLCSDGSKEDSTQLHHVDGHICSFFNRSNSSCSRCTPTTERTIDLSKTDLDYFNVGDIILGDIKTIGWIVVKGEPMTPLVHSNIQVISESNDFDWFNIEPGTHRVQKYNSTFEKMNLC